MADHQVVLGIFPNEAAADAAVESLKSWDQATDEIKLGAIGAAGGFLVGRQTIAPEILELVNAELEAAAATA